MQKSSFFVLYIMSKNGVEKNSKNLPKTIDKICKLSL